MMCRFLLYGFAASSIAFWAGCATDPAVTGRPVEATTQEKFEDANALLDNHQYAEAAKAFDKLRVDKPVSQLDFFVLLNSGIAYQSKGDCITAAERYRQVVRVAHKKSPPTQAMARLRLSDVLSCQGNDRLAIVNLVELYRTRRYLPMEIAEAEIPARLAAAYARAGNKKLADKYFKEAEAGYRKILRSYTGDRQKPILARTLYLMGNMSHLDPQKASSEDYFTTVRALQSYLFRAAEMNVENWSKLATEQLQDNYKKTWQYLDAPAPVSDDSLVLREALVKKREAAMQALVALRELYREKIPGPPKSPYVSEILTVMARTEKQLEAYLATTKAGTNLTKEAEKADAVKQDVNP